MKNNKFRKNKVFAFAVFLAVLCVLFSSCSFVRDFIADNKSETVNTLSYRREDGEISIHFIDVGQGDAILIVADDGSAMTIDAGTNESESTLTDYISGQKITHLEYALFTHNHSDHIGGGDKLLERFEVGKVLVNGYSADTVSYTNLISLAEKENVPCYTLSVGDEFSLGSISFTVLGPVRPDYDDDNDSSIALKLTYGNTSVLFMGDCEKQAEEDMLSLWGEEIFDCDVIKIGHHGSSSSTGEEFLSICSPKYAVISCGKNNDYGHPHSSVLKLLEKYSVTILRTDINENIIFTSDGNVIEPVT